MTKTNRKKIMLVFGTRPEAIKMCPVIKKLKSNNLFEVIVCVTGQHKEMLDQVLEIFQIEPDYNLEIMKEKQSLCSITKAILDGIEPILLSVKPDIVLVHGDTSSTFATSLACFYLQIPVGHVEAGLRTYNLFSPYPEEFNRQSVGIIANYHFAPTKKAAENLKKEGKNEKDIFITGNTAIDALQYTVKKDYYHKDLEWAKDSRLILLTAHRRENIGEPMRHMFRAIKRIVEHYKDTKVIYPIHMNPSVRKIAEEEIGGIEKIKIIEPLNVLDFHNFMARSFMVLTDSGGIQEEAPSFGIPVLVMRDTTERPEGVGAGVLRLVGTEEENLYSNIKELIDDEESYKKMAHAVNPYGDGHASEYIADILIRKLLDCIDK